MFWVGHSVLLVGTGIGLLILIAAVICFVSSVYTYFDLGARWNPAYNTGRPSHE